VNKTTSVEHLLGKLGFDAHKIEEKDMLMMKELILSHALKSDEEAAL